MRVRRAGLISIAALMLSACGNGEDSAGVPAAGPAELSGTLAYVVSVCRDTPKGVSIEQTLRIQRGEAAPVDVRAIETLSDFGFSNCAVSARLRIYASTLRAVFQRLAVSPDGMRVAFEVSDEFAPSFHDVLTAEEKGFFVVGADGTGLRRLGPPSRESAVFISNGASYATADFNFSPDGRAVVFIDKGADEGGQEATQIFWLDLASGMRRQLTALPVAVAGPDTPPGVAPVGLLTFIDATTLGFLSIANPNGLNPRGEIAAFTVRTDGSRRIEALPAATLVAGGRIDPRFQITGDRPQAGIVILPGEPAGPPASPLLGIEEIFLRDGHNLLQLTNFHRADTFAIGPLSRDGQRVFFQASADPLRINPTNNCQLFSVDRTGDDLRQLTRFEEGRPSLNGCSIFYAKPFGCSVNFMGEDAVTGSLVFQSTCNALGTNPNGSQIFAVRPDGSGLRQLTNFSGLVLAGNSGSAEGPATIAFASAAPGN